MACGKSITMPLLVGSKKKKVGEVTVANDDENLYLTFKTDSKKYMKKIYLYVGTKEDVPYYSNGFPNLRKFNYKAFPYYYGGKKKATYVIPLSEIDTDCFEVIAYAKVFDKRSWCNYTAFAYNKKKTQRYYYSYYSGCYYFKKWVRSFEYCKQECHDDCVQAYGFKYPHTDYDKPSLCFLEEGFDTWGWTMGPFDYKNRYNKVFFKVDGPMLADMCKPENGPNVGYAEFIVEDDSTGEVKVNIVIEDTNYRLRTTSVYIGNSKYPVNAMGDPTVNPYYYGNTHNNLSGALQDSFTVNNVSGQFYIIINANVCLVNKH